MSATNTSNNMEPVNMYFSRKGIEKNVLPKDNSSTAYIIFQNNELHTKLEELKKELNEVTVDRDEKESEIDGLSRTRTCLQGYVKNEYELAMNWKTVATFYEKQVNIYEKKWCMSYMINTLFMIMMTFIQSFQFRVTFVCLYVPFMFYLNTKYVIMMKNESKKDETVKDSKDKIEKINKSNIYIEELVDNI